MENTDVVQLLNHIGDQEKHFNGLETQYRLLSSTWLLTSLGAIGFLLKDEREGKIDNFKLLLIGLIGIVASIGIILLWTMDIRVYHKLLNCVFLRGILLELEHPWLPKIRTDMLLSRDTGEVGTTTVWYYIWSAMLLQAVAVGAFVYRLGLSIPGILAALVGLVIIFFVASNMKKGSGSPRTGKLFEELKAHYIDDIEHFKYPVAKSGGQGG